MIPWSWMVVGIPCPSWCYEASYNCASWLSNWGAGLFALQCFIGKLSFFLSVMFLGCFSNERLFTYFFLLFSINSINIAHFLYKKCV